MTSRVLRTMLLMIFVAGAGAAAYSIWTGESEARASRDVVRVFDQQTRMLMRGVLELRAAQEGYVAVGQGDQFWATKVTGLIASLRERRRRAQDRQRARCQGRIGRSIFLLNVSSRWTTAPGYARSGQVVARPRLFRRVERTKPPSALDEAQLRSRRARSRPTGFGGSKRWPAAPRPFWVS